MYITTTEYTPDLKDHETPKGRPTSRQLHSNEVTHTRGIYTVHGEHRLLKFGIYSRSFPKHLFN